MTRLIGSIPHCVPAGLNEIAQLGRNLVAARDEILAFFDHHAPTDRSKPYGPQPMDSAITPTTESTHFRQA